MKNNLNWANRLTFLRILFIPIFAISLLYHKNVIAFLVFTLASISDVLDGFIARSYGQKTTLGSILDPMADMLLLTTAFIVLTILEWIPIWLTVIVVSRNVIILMGAATVFIINKELIASTTFTGKVTTSLQLILIMYTLFTLCFNLPSTFIFKLLFWVIAILSSICVLQYIVIGTNVVSHSNGKKNIS